jgi:hypothetical protein
MRRAIALASAPLLAALAAGCGGSGSGSANPTITIAPARTFHLGQPLTRYRRGPGPHTGIHLIIVRSDLGAIIHHHPPVGPHGRLTDTLVFPTPGRYRMVVDVYPQLSGPLRNFQLFRWITVAGRYNPQPLPPYRPTDVVDGYRFSLVGKPRLKAIEATLLRVRVTTPAGKPAGFTPWYGALAHAIFFRKGSLDYFHTHVCSPNATGCTSILAGSAVTGRSSTPGKLTVGVLVPVPGTWRLFLQCKVDGHILTAPFTLTVT